MSRPKVIVAGGGPAGCAAAYTMARNLIDVVVFERGQPGKDKACGDALVPSAVELLNIFGIDEERMTSLGGYRYNRVNFYLKNTLSYQSEYQNEYGWVIKRAVIDQEIRNITSKIASVQYRTSVTDISFEQENIEVTIRQKDGGIDRQECDAVVIATGALNQLSQKFDIDGEPNRAIAISMYAEMNPSDVLQFQFFDQNIPGYRWIFPVSGKLVNLGVGIRHEKPKTNLKALGEELLKNQEADPVGRWRGAVMTMWSGSGHLWHHPAGIVSCGDAAGLINPFSGEGMTAALLSGRQAGEAIQKYLLENRNRDRLQEYSRWILDHFNQQYKSNPSIPISK